jgi:hypothetical protein
LSSTVGDHSDIDLRQLVGYRAELLGVTVKRLKAATGEAQCGSGCEKHAAFHGVMRQRH